MIRIEVKPEENAADAVRAALEAHGDKNPGELTIAEVSVLWSQFGGAIKRLFTEPFAATQFFISKPKSPEQQPPHEYVFTIIPPNIVGRPEGKLHILFFEDKDGIKKVQAWFEQGAPVIFVPDRVLDAKIAEPIFENIQDWYEHIMSENHLM